MNKSPAVFVAALVFLNVEPAAHAHQPHDSAPVFSQPLYSVTVDLSPPGLETFSFSGTVSDADVGDVVTVFSNHHASFMRFAQTRGNPATFTLSSVGLSYATAFGIYDSGFVAFDDASPPRVESARWRVTIVPEPTGAAMLTLTAAILGRRSRRLFA